MALCERERCRYENSTLALVLARIIHSHEDTLKGGFAETPKPKT